MNGRSGPVTSLNLNFPCNAVSSPRILIGEMTPVLIETVTPGGDGSMGPRSGDSDATGC